MTPTTAAVVAAALLWLLLPMNVAPTRESWRYKEYWLCLALFGLAGVAFLIGITDSTNPIPVVLRFWVPAAMAAGIALLNVIHGAQIRMAGLLLLSIFVPMAAFSISERLGMPLLSLAMLMPAIIVPKSGYSTAALQTGLRDAVRIMVMALLTFVALFPGVIIGPCRSDKCSFWGLALGPVGSGNAFGVYVAFICGLSVILARNARVALLVVLATGVIVDATSSRSAMLSWGITVVAAIVWRLLRTRGRTRLLALLSAGTLGLVTFFAMYPWRPEDFTGRANLWIVAKEYFIEHPIFGLGPSFWVRQDRTSYVDSNYATHNLLLELLVSGGLFAVVALLAAVVLLVKNADRSVCDVTLVLTTAWLASSVLEVSAAPGRTYLLPGILLLLFVYGQSHHSPSLSEHAAGSSRKKKLQSATPLVA